MIRVSVVIPVYKVEKYIHACVDSVLSQTLQDIEVICIDDASPDRCPEILDEYAVQDARVRVLHLPENHQQGYGRNRGLEMAKGKYVYFLDSDDMITPEVMEELYNLAEREQLDGVFFDSRVIFENKEFEKKYSNYPARRHGKYENKVYSGQELFESFMQQGDWSCYVQREFWKREYLLDNKVFFPESTEHEDEYFTFRGVLLAKRVRYTPADYFIRRYRADSVMTRSAHAKDFHGYFINSLAMVDMIEELGYTNAAIDTNIMYMFDSMEFYFPFFSAKEDPKKWFRTKEEIRAYRSYCYSKRADNYFRRMLKFLTVPVPPKNHVWIYGAGVVGQRVYRIMVNCGYIVDGFLVTHKEGNPDVLCGREVFQIDEVKPAKDKTAVVAISGAAREEMRCVLENLGWNYSIYITGR